MKNLKKVLAMVLAFACTFSMFAGAKVFEDVPAGSDYSEAITMLSDLGVIQGKDDGKYHPEDTITRAEACAMIARMMTGDPNVSQYVGAQSFTDVAKGSWKDSAIGYCYINGIVIGVGNNKFEPDRAITDAEFVTMVVRAMGYETADMKQNYPFSYMSNAQAIGLLDGTNMVASTDALRGEDAQVIYNALFTDYARGAKLVNTTHGTSVEQYPTLAESVWGLDRAAIGTWDKDDKDDETAELTNCKAHTWVVVGSDPAEEGYILAYPIDDDTTDLYKTDKNDVDGNAKDGYHTYSFKYAGDADAVAGYQVELWGQGSHGEPTWEKSGNKVVYSEDWEIKAIKTVKGQKAYDYNASMADKKDDNGTIELDGDVSLDLESVADNAKEAKFTAQNPEVVTFLGGELNTVTVKDDKSVEKALNVRNGNQYKLVDWDSDGDVDWVVVDQANYYKVESVNSKRLTVSSMKADKALDSDKDDESKTWKLDDLEKVGKNAADKDVKIKYVAPDDLEEGDVIEVTYKIAYDKGEKAQVITATATKVEAENHELDKVSTKDTLELTFDGEVTKIAQNANKGDVIDPANPDKYEDFDDEELGTEFALWTNRNGFIVYSDYATESSNYMMILDTGDGSDKTGDRKEAKADILLADNSVKKDVKFATDLKIDGKNNGDTGYDKDSREWDETKVVGNVYKYWQDEDGVITKMEAAISDDVKSSTDYSYDESSDRLKNKDDKYVASLEEAKVVFAVKPHTTAEGYITGKQVDSKWDLEVDEDDVLAVKQADIPDIVKSTKTGDTKAEILVKNDLDNTWLGNQNSDSLRYIAEVNNNGEASAAVLGVDSFNKFNDAATKVGLVTSVSYNKNDVVEVEVAVNGEVTTLKSAEKVDFDDIVEKYNKTSNKDEGLNAKDIARELKNNALYAEITTNADGVLTNVTFMDVDGNNAVGHYYEVSRRIVSKVKSGNVAYGNQSYYYYNDKNLYSVGRLEVSDKDLDKDVQYYSIDGRPTTHDDKYEDVTLAIVNGFDGTPDITAATDSNLVESYINNKFDDADTYYVADLAYKIDGDIVAAYAFEDSLGEVEATNGAIVAPVKDAALEAGESNQKIADVTLYDASAPVSSVTIKKDGVVVTNVKGEVNKGVLQVSADADAVAGTDYTAEFTVGTGKDARTYTVKFAVKTTTVAVPENTIKPVDGHAAVVEKKATSTITFDGAQESGETKCAVTVNGTQVEVALAAQDGKNLAAGKVAKAINEAFINGVTAEAAGAVVTVTGDGVDTDLAFQKGSMTKLTATVNNDNGKYVAAADATDAVVEITFKSGVNVDSKILVEVDDHDILVALKANDTAADVATKVAAAAKDIATNYEVTVDGAKVTFTAVRAGAWEPTASVSAAK